jgi:biopolymer transport protein ExbD
MPIRSKLKPAEWDMTPMIDVVFLLMVFFTLVLNFAAADRNERIKLPISELAQPPEMPPTDPITLHVLADGNVIYNGNVRTLQQQKEHIEQQLRFLKNMNVPLDKVQVIVRADAQCESGKVFDVIELCKGLSLTQLILRTKQKEE